MESETLFISLTDIGKFTGISSPNKAWLVDYLKGTIDYLGNLAKAFPLTICMPCGQQAVYDNLDDIPDKSTHCPCGNPDHWLIKYQQEAQP